MPRETTRTMILGIVSFRGPIGGYGIEKTLSEWSVSRWTTIAPASIYQQLRSLSSAGFIAPVDGLATRATEYTCTTTGRQKLRDLLLSLLNEQNPQPLSLIPLLHFTPALTREELIEGLTERIARITDALDYEDQVIKRAVEAGPSHVTEIFRLTWEGLRADRSWCEGYLERLRN